jgi:quinol monooxygenase YgiN
VRFVTQLPGDISMKQKVVVVAYLRAAKGKGDALAEVLTEQVGVVRKAEPGCLVYTLHRSTKDPERFFFYEVYADEAAFDVHRNAPYQKAYRERREREGLVEGTVDVDVLRALTD